MKEAIARTLDAVEREREREREYNLNNKKIRTGFNPALDIAYIDDG